MSRVMAMANTPSLNASIRPVSFSCCVTNSFGSLIAPTPPRRLLRRDAPKHLSRKAPCARASDDLKQLSSKLYRSKHGAGNHPVSLLRECFYFHLRYLT